MTFEQLLYTVELAKHHSINTTAELLHISKSGLSQAINQFESELGLKIFKRTHAGSFLTDQGRDLLPMMRKMLTDQLALVNKAGQITHVHHAQQLRLAYSNTMLRPFIDQYLQLQASQPNQLSLQIHRQSTPRIIAAVRKHTLDAGFIAINDHHLAGLRDLRFNQLVTSRLNLVVSPENPLAGKEKLSVADLKKQRFALFTDSYNDQLFNHLQFLAVPLTVILRIDDGWGMYQAITRLGAACFARDYQTQLSSFQPLSTLPHIAINNLVNDQFKLGWLTNPQYELSSLGAEFIKKSSQNIRQIVEHSERSGRK